MGFQVKEFLNIYSFLDIKEHILFQLLTLYILTLKIKNTKPYKLYPLILKSVKEKVMKEIIDLQRNCKKAQTIVCMALRKLLHGRKKIALTWFLLGGT